MILLEIGVAAMVLPVAGTLVVLVTAPIRRVWPR